MLVPETRPGLPFGLIALYKRGNLVRLWTTLHFRFCLKTTKRIENQTKICMAEVTQRLDEMLRQVNHFAGLYKRMHQTKYNKIRWYLINNISNLLARWVQFFYIVWKTEFLSRTDTSAWNISFRAHAALGCRRSCRISLGPVISFWIQKYKKA
jgi:hypothetical protein